MDERGLADLLLHVQRLSGYLAFDPGMKKSSVTWKDHLQNDIVFLLADVSACSVAEIRGAYRLLEGEFDRDPEAGRFWLLLTLSIRFSRSLTGGMSGRWQSVTMASSGWICSFISSPYLSSKLAELNQIRRHAGMMVPSEDQRSTPVYIIRNTDKVWGDPDSGDKAYGERIFTGQQDEEKLLNAAIRLKEIFDTVIHVIEQVVNRSQSYMEEALHEKKDHQPHIALMITFLELYGYARDEINKLPRRHLDFYYEKSPGDRPPRSGGRSGIVYISRRRKVFGPYELKRAVCWLREKTG